MKTTVLTRLIAPAMLAGGIQLATAANILWVSDAPPAGFSGPGTNYTDQGFVTLLQKAGHNVTRFNGPDSQNTNLTAVEISTINTNDLIIIGRATASGAFQAPQVNQWNTNINKPLICMSTYLSRGSRLGWFVTADPLDGTPAPVIAANPNDPATDYLLGGVAMIGNKSVFNFDEMLDRNISYLLTAPIAGGRTLLTVNCTREDIVTNMTGVLVADVPAGTVVRGSNILAGYRMSFAAGTRESATAPNAIGSATGRETLTPTGESIFIRAIQLALNNGVPPATDPSAPVGIITDLVDVTAVQNAAASFSIAVTGAAPRQLVWQRDTGDGVTFTNIPDATTTFSSSIYTLPLVAISDDNARFRVIVSNTINSITSSVVKLTVVADTEAPKPVSAASLDGSSIVVYFNELLDNTSGTTEDPFNYGLSDAGSATIQTATTRADGRSVFLALTAPLGSGFTLNINGISDRFGNSINDPVAISGTNFGFTAANIGTQNPVGTNFAVNSSTIVISGGGLDVVGTADSMRFVYKDVSGDFDAKVRVLSLVGSDRLESVAKALLAVRDNLSNNAAAVYVYATPPTPADDAVVAIMRTNAATSMANLGTAFVPGGPSNTWLRIQRIGNVITAMRSSNGMDWVEFGRATPNLGSNVLVGLGVSSHRNSRLATATFSDFKIGPAIGKPSFVNSSLNSGAFSSSFLAQNGVSYKIEYKNLFPSASWTPLTNFTGDGSLRTFRDPGPISPTGQRFYRISIP